MPRGCLKNQTCQLILLWWSALPNASADVKALGPANQEDPFSLGIDWAQYEKPWTDSPSTDQNTKPLLIPLIPNKLTVSHATTAISCPQSTNKGYNSDPETSRSSRLTPFSSNKLKQSFLWSSPTNLYVGGTDRTPSVLNRKWSESALLLRVFEDDEKAKLGGKRLSFEFTDTPVKKKLCTSGRIAKSPWRHLLAHPARNAMLTLSFAEWVTATSSPVLTRNWVVHATPRYIEMTGAELKNMLCANLQLSYNLFDLAVRRIVQLDADMFSRESAQVWRTILESDFAMLVLAECTHTNNISIRTQFLGAQIKHEIKNCRMIAVPALVRENWCSYFWDMKLKMVHVVDPLFNEDRSCAFRDIHEPNVIKLRKALSTCVKDFFESWSPDWVDWKITFVKPLTPNATTNQTGILTLIALRDFNGTNYANEANEDFIIAFSQLLLHEVISIDGNEGSIPDNFIKSKDS